ncbi:hypothetical protein [Kocuria sp. UCD-OTCP]|uniref:hypothetical protein n=1 Tax=Kocuria sp. UCD-OTCP TaxID=1292021 RepID=UPI00036C4E4D|nr:hypothetical protein [Kocuria sp. UCD-OTCP]EYT54245.1 hypothetical protein H488_0104340 [Kocuria sp. UCD-OTCP]
MTRALRILVYGTIIAAGFVLLISTDHPLVVQAVVLVVMAFIGTLALYKPRAEATTVVSVAVALLLLAAALYSAQLGFLGVLVVALFLLLVVAAWGGGRRTRVGAGVTHDRQ